MQVVTFRVTALAKVTAPPVASAGRAHGELRTALRATRQVYFPELGGFVDCPIYDRELIPYGAGLEGPAILEQMDSTTVVLPGQLARNDAEGNVILTFQ